LHAECFTLKYFAGNFYRWSGSHYERFSDNAIESDVLSWLTRAVMLKQDKPVSFPANSIP
jgi:hypothetical protein